MKICIIKLNALMMIYIIKQSHQVNQFTDSLSFLEKNKTTNDSIYGPLRLRIFDKNGDTTYIKPISIPQELIPSGDAAIKVINKPSWIK